MIRRRKAAIPPLTRMMSSSSSRASSATNPCWAANHSCSSRRALRHTAASLSISAGANVKAVQRMLGHARMTLDVYADLFDEDLDGVADRLDAGIRSAADPLRTQTRS